MMITTQLFLVITTYHQPIAGWVDTLYGPMGITVLCALGLLHIYLLDTKVKVDLIPADYVVNTILATSWHDFSTRRNVCKGLVPVYNISSSTQNPITWGQFTYVNQCIGEGMSTNKRIYHSWMIITKYYFLYRILTFVFHIIPAYFLDLLLKLFGRKPV